jgi:hypothetical protein
VTFKDFLDHLRAESGTDLPMNHVKPSEVPETLSIEDEFADDLIPQVTLEDLLAKAQANGFKQSDIVIAARVYHNQTNIHRLTPEQIEDLDRRLTAKIEKNNGGKTPAHSSKSSDKRSSENSKQNS